MVARALATGISLLGDHTDAYERLHMCMCDGVCVCLCGWGGSAPHFR
jgi:hypothetical protein